MNTSSIINDLMTYVLTRQLWNLHSISDEDEFCIFLQNSYILNHDDSLIHFYTLSNSVVLNRLWRLWTIIFFFLHTIEYHILRRWYRNSVDWFTFLHYVPRLFMIKNMIKTRVFIPILRYIIQDELSSYHESFENL